MAVAEQPLAAPRGGFAFGLASVLSLGGALRQAQDSALRQAQDRFRNEAIPRAGRRLLRFARNDNVAGFGKALRRGLLQFSLNRDLWYNINIRTSFLIRQCHICHCEPPKPAKQSHYAEKRDCFGRFAPSQ